MSAWFWAKAAAMLGAVRLPCAATLVILIGMASGATAQTFTPFPLPDNQSTPNAITKGPGNTLWFTDPGTNSIGRITTAGVITIFPLPSTSSSPQGIVLGSDGALWFAEGGTANPPYNPPKIGRIDPAIATHDNPQIQEYSTSNNAGAGAITSGPDGNIWVVHDADPSRVIERFPIAGGAGEVYFFPDPQPPHGPICVIYPGKGIAAEVGNSLLFTGTTCGSRSIGLIGRVTPGGGLSVVVDENYGLPGSPIGIIPGPDGAFWFTADNAKIGRVTSAGAVTIFDVLGGHIATTVFALTAGSDGALWLAPNYNCCGSMSIRRITTAGVVTEFPDPAPGGFNGGFNGITVGPDGNLWFTQQGARIGRMTPPAGSTSTSTSLGSSPAQSVFGQSVTFTATVTTGAGTPTGSVTFKDGASTLGSGALSSGTASYSTSALAVASHTITAVYEGDSTFAPSTSSGLTETVNTGATTATVTASNNPSVFGQSVTFTATVAVTAPAAGTPSGTVAFQMLGTTIGTGNVSAGKASFTTASLSVGSHTIAALYSGDASFHASTSSGLNHTVNKAATTLSIGAKPNPSKPGFPVSFTATVSVTAPATGTATGTVAFREGAKTLGTGTLASGKATFTTSALTIGKHTVSASFAGTSTLAASTGSVILKVDPRLGPEFRVNTHTANSQQQPSVTRLSGNQFVVAWASNAQDGSGFGIYGQRYDQTGAKVGGEFRVNTTMANDQSQPSVAAIGSIGFVVTWQSGRQDGSGLGIYGQRYDNTGARVGVEFRVNTVAIAQSLPSVAGLADSSFVVTWQSIGQDGSGLGIYAQRFSSTGAKVGIEFRVNTTTAADQSQPSVAALNGIVTGFVVTWQSNGQDGSGLGIYGQRFSNAGAKVGIEFRVNTTVANDQSLPSVAGLKDGSFIVVWQSNLQDGSLLGVYAQRYQSTGAKAGVEFRVNTATAQNQWQPSVAGFIDGGFVIAWSSSGQDGSGQGVYGQAYDTTGKRVDVEFPVNTTTANDQWQPAVAAFSATSFVVAWTSGNQDGSLEGVYGQRFNIAGVTAAAKTIARSRAFAK